MKYGKGSSKGKTKVVSPKKSPSQMLPKGDPTVAIAKKAIAKKKGTEGPKRSMPRKKK